MAAAAEFRVEMKFTSARDLKNVNWRDEGYLRPYFCAWVEGGSKQYTYVADANGGGSYSWERQILYLPFSTHDEGATIHIQCLHHLTPDDHPETKTSIGSTQIDLHLHARNIGTQGKWVQPPTLPTQAQQRPPTRGDQYQNLHMQARSLCADGG